MAILRFMGKEGMMNKERDWKLWCVKGGRGAWYRQNLKSAFSFPILKNENIKIIKSDTWLFSQSSRQMFSSNGTENKMIKL